MSIVEFAKLTSVRFNEAKSQPFKLFSARIIPCILAAERSCVTVNPFAIVLLKSAFDKFAFVKSVPVNFAEARFENVRFYPAIFHPDISNPEAPMPESFLDL